MCGGSGGSGNGGRSTGAGGGGSPIEATISSLQSKNESIMQEARDIQAAGGNPYNKYMESMAVQKQIAYQKKQLAKLTAKPVNIGPTPEGFTKTKTGFSRSEGMAYARIEPKNSGWETTRRIRGNGPMVRVGTTQHKSKASALKAANKFIEESK